MPDTKTETTNRVFIRSPTSVLSPGRAAVHSQACERLEERPNQPFAALEGRQSTAALPGLKSFVRPRWFRGSHPWLCTARPSRAQSSPPFQGSILAALPGLALMVEHELAGVQECPEGIL